MFVHQANGLGGAVKSLSLILSSLDIEKYDVSIFLPGFDDNTIKFLQRLNIRTFHDKDSITFGSAQGVSLGFSFWKFWTLPIFWKQFFNSVSAFEKLISEYQPDLVYLNTVVLTPYGIASKRQNVKVIWHVREELRVGIFNVWGWITRKIIRTCATKVICISAVNKRKLGIDSAEIIYNYISTPPLRFDESVQDKKKQLGIKNNQFILVMLGGVIWSKGLPTLLKAMAYVILQEPNIHLIIAGHPIKSTEKNYFENLKNKFRRQKNTSKECLDIIKENVHLKEKTTFVGFQNEIDSLISISDVLVWPGRVSHFARPIMEAFSFGKPVIASDFESSREIVFDGKNGLLFQANDALDLSNKIVYLVNNPILRNQMGEAGFKFAQQHFQSSENTQKIMSVIEHTLEIW